MVINELFPDPIGGGKTGEWLELFNESDKIANLSGWRIEDAGGKVFFLDNFIVKPRAYLTLDYKTTKIVLNNNSEKIFLYDSGDKLIDKAEYFSGVPRGKSLARVKDKNDFIITETPTPGEENIFQAAKGGEETASQIIGDFSAADYPVVVNEKEFNFDVLLVALVMAIVLALFSAVVLKKFDLLSD
ncbi:lamin tail domain-containing protein [Candidatus Wolfebacteria bacterium]|nr:lamin tail domain-containing protein [Candidatus Wolfebacteria bacterium]